MFFFIIIIIQCVMLIYIFVPCAQAPVFGQTSPRFNPLSQLAEITVAKRINVVSHICLQWQKTSMSITGGSLLWGFLRQSWGHSVEVHTARGHTVCA